MINKGDNMKTIETPLAIKDVAFKLNADTRFVNYYTVDRIVVYSRGMDYNASSEKYGSVEFSVDDIGKDIRLNDEDFLIDRDKVITRLKLHTFIDKPVWDTFTKQWVFLKFDERRVIELTDTIQLMNSDGNILEVSMVGYGKYWGLSIEELS